MKKNLIPDFDPETIKRIQKVFEGDEAEQLGRAWYNRGSKDITGNLPLQSRNMERGFLAYGTAKQKNGNQNVFPLNTKKPRRINLAKDYEERKNRPRKPPSRMPENPVAVPPQFLSPLYLIIYSIL